MALSPVDEDLGQKTLCVTGDAWRVSARTMQVEGAVRKLGTGFLSQETRGQRGQGHFIQGGDFH